MRLFCSDTGQASADYVALVAVVAVVLGGMVAVASPALGSEVLGAMRHAICVVGGAICSPEEAQQAGLDPCVVQMQADDRRVGAMIFVVRLRRGDKMVVERKSDGSVSVAFVDTNDVGAEAGVGLKLGRFVNDRAHGAAGVRFTSGRSHKFSDWERARQFIERHAQDETGMAALRNAGRRITGRAPREYRIAEETSYEAGGWGEIEGVLDMPTGRRGGGSRWAEAGFEQAVVLGRRRGTNEHTGESETTVYLSMDQAATLGLGAVVSAVGGLAGSVLELTIDDTGKLTKAVATGSGAVSRDFDLYGHSTNIKALGAKLRSGVVTSEAAARSGYEAKVRVSLDLENQHVRGAVAGVLEVVSGRAPAVLWQERVQALGRRLDEDGIVDLEMYDSTEIETDSSLELGLVAKFGLENVRTHNQQRLVGAWTVERDGMREREDCMNAVAA